MFLWGYGVVDLPRLPMRVSTVPMLTVRSRPGLQWYPGFNHSAAVITAILSCAHAHRASARTASTSRITALTSIISSSQNPRSRRCRFAS